MTVINGIEIDHIDYKVNDIKAAIKNNDPIEEKLHVILVISNPCLYARRYILLKEFVKRMEEEEENVIVYIVELCYGKQKFIVTQSGNKRHLQLRTQTPLWHKENMIDMGVKLLPPGFKAFAWIDADIEFDTPTWAMDTLRILNGSKDIVQLFSHAVDMYRDESNIQIFNGFGYSFCKKKTMKDLWHPGFAWAMTRKAYEKVGIFDKGILGSGDHIMARSIIHQAPLHPDYHPDYNQSMLDYQEKAKHLRLGYTPGVIRHFYHGSKKNRKYVERWQILIKHQFSPSQLKYENGILVPNEYFSKDLADDIMMYFQERKEDE